MHLWKILQARISWELSTQLKTLRLRTIEQSFLITILMSSGWKDSGRDIRLEVDGGVKVDNIAAIQASGADTFVAGSAILGRPDYAATIKSMRAALAAA